MGKVQVRNTIAQAYKFAFQHYLRIFGAIWLPFVLIGAFAYYYLLPSLSALPSLLNDIAQHRALNPTTPYFPPGLGRVLGSFLLFTVFTFLIFPAIAAGVTKEALGLRRGPSFIYYAVGKRELLVLGGFFTLMAMYLCAVVVLGFSLGIIGGIVAVSMATASSSHADVAKTIATMLAVVRVVTIVFYLVVIYFFVRLGYLMVPISIAESRFGVWQSWKRTRGNFWRIIGIVLGTILPLTILSYAVWIAAFGPGILKVMWYQPVQPGAVNPEFTALMQLEVRYAAYIWLAGLVFAPISNGLMFGPSAFAYRALVPPDESQ